MSGQEGAAVHAHAPVRSRGQTGLVAFAHALLRLASSADGVIVGLYLAALDREYGHIQADVS